MKNLACDETRTGRDHPAAGRRKQVVMAFAKGIVDLAQYGAQCAGAVVAEPETHRTENVTEHTRKSLQPDLAVCLSNTLTRQQRAYPGERRRTVARAMIAEHETEQVPTVESEQGATQGLRIG